MAVAAYPKLDWNQLLGLHVVRKVAQDLGVHATFMPKPIAGDFGSGMPYDPALGFDNYVRQLDDVLERCDGDALPSLLYSTKPRNVPFYERLGWRVAREEDGNWYLYDPDGEDRGVYFHDLPCAPTSADDAWARAQEYDQCGSRDLPNRAGDLNAAVTLPLRTFALQL